MANEVRIKLTAEQKAKIKSATGKIMSEIRVGSLGNSPAVSAPRATRPALRERWKRLDARPADGGGGLDPRPANGGSGLDARPADGGSGLDARPADGGKRPRPALRGRWKRLSTRAPRTVEAASTRAPRSSGTD